MRHYWRDRLGAKMVPIACIPPCDSNSHTVCDVGSAKGVAWLTVTTHGIARVRSRYRY